MSDQDPWAGVQTAVLTEGIKFLYAQAGEALKRWRDRKAGSTTDPAPPMALPAVFQGSSSGVAVDDNRLAAVAEAVREQRRELADYADGIEPVNPGDLALREKVDALRRLMEGLYGQPLTFLGEQRRDDGVHSLLSVDRVLGDVAAVRARLVEGHVAAEARAGTVEAGGRLTGIEADTVRGGTR